MKKKLLWRLLSGILCLLLCVELGIPTMAANENNTRGVTFDVTLDTPTISVSDEDQDVVMRLKASQGITVDGIGFTATKDSPLTISSITGGEKIGAFPAASTNLDDGIAGWHSPDSENITDVIELAVITFHVPANTPAGTYEVGINELELTNDYGDIWENSATASTILTISDNSALEGYTAGVNTLTEDVVVDETAIVNIAVEHDSDSSFAAGEIVIQYDNTKLSFNQQNSVLGAATIKDESGTLTLEDYGANKNFGSGVYSLAFDAIADGPAIVTMTSAAFVNKSDAAKKDLLDAIISPEKVEFTIHKKTYSVTLPDIFTGQETVEDGASYTFSQADGDNYDYGTVTATVNGENVAVINNGDGTYTVENVTGQLVISGTRSEKIYQVVFSGNAAEEIKDGAATATYDTDYSFTMPSVSGWAYSLDSITIGGKAYTGYTVSNSVYTIPGSAIKGDIIITVNKSATEASVTVIGSGAGAAAGYETKVDIGSDYTLRITPEKGYTYTVTAEMSNQTATVINNGDNTYTIKSVTGDIVFTVEKLVIVDGISIEQYLTLNGSVMWLVKNEIDLTEGKVPTYDGENMFWSGKYNAYCYLVIANTLSIDDVKQKVDITDGTPIAINYNMDVNKTTKIDASDAQLVYNMYNAEYEEISKDITMEKYLIADVNGDCKINVEDSVAIISNILK